MFQFSIHLELLPVTDYLLLCEQPNKGDKLVKCVE